MDVQDDKNNAETTRRLSHNILQSGDIAHDMELNLRLRVTEMLATLKHQKLNVEMPSDMLQHINYKRKRSLWVTLNRRVSFPRGIYLLSAYLNCNVSQ
jgi:hypothetical protein